jgi:hypothetical protein
MVIRPLACFVLVVLLSQEDAVVRTAQAIDDRVLTLAGHTDINPVNFTAGRNYTQTLPIQVDLHDL